MKPVSFIKFLSKMDNYLSVSANKASVKQQINKAMINVILVQSPASLICTLKYDSSGTYDKEVVTDSQSQTYKSHNNVHQSF